MKYWNRCITALRIILEYALQNKNFPPICRKDGKKKKNWTYDVEEIFNFSHETCIWQNGLIRLISPGTVGNNLGPDRLPGPNALDPNYCRQPTL